MSRLTINTVATAPSDAQARVEAVEKANGFIPNLIGVLSNAPTALEMYQEVGKINARTSLSAAEIEVVQITAARINECGFCVAGHTKISTLKKLFAEEVLTAIRAVEDFAAQEPKLNALARYTVAVMQNKGAVSDAELAAFFAAGYNQQQAVEVVLGVALATLCNYTNNLAQTEINEQLQAFA
ncbi:carboxymuconolactone decarboxylase family protein [Vitreoscilla stercoraria]|uniref:Carboxymuconolactone decarboxylase family protein n=1 Tax=Vitreoscilla stercoraria TaxID=61 RepID=A0ABY4E7S9_VITST|nr:carboxymuconolactone decarboxylase family protein [Vitreoscilla stercoraria]UOO91816.1 carboxymuconolactone decarboxylase family protein [Vitreoscilla stercoraria]